MAEYYAARITLFDTNKTLAPPPSQIARADAGGKSDLQFGHKLGL
jgi:hypothetical protein